MERNELMVGDWVYRPDCHDKVKEIRENGIIGEDSFRGLIGFSELKPIPLTTEILEKNGFDISDPEVKQYHFEEDGQRYHFSLRQMYNKDNKPDGYSFFAFSVLTIIDYVHQLQLAFKLCGIDKEIVL